MAQDSKQKKDPHDSWWESIRRSDATIAAASKISQERKAQGKPGLAETIYKRIKKNIMGGN